MPAPNYAGLVAHNNGPRIEGSVHQVGEGATFLCPVCRVSVTKFISLFVGQWFGRMCNSCAQQTILVLGELLDGKITKEENES